MKKILASVVAIIVLMTSISILPVSAEVTVENFEAFTLSVSTQGGGNGFQRLVINAGTLPFEMTTANELVGLYINGTATPTSGTGSVFEFQNVVVTASAIRTNASTGAVTGYNIDFAIQSGFDTTGSTTYSYDLTLSREQKDITSAPDEGGDDETGDSNITIDNFEPFKLPTAGAFNSPEKVVIDQGQLSNIPFTLDSANLLKGCYLNGTATKADGTVITFTDEEITSSAVRAAGGYELYFAEKATLGYDNHTWDLTLSRTPLGTGGGDDSEDNEPDTPSVFDPYNFTPFKLTVTGDGAQGLKRLIVKASDFPVALTSDNQLVGCLLNGTATPTASGIANGYTETITFTDVMVEKSSIRTGATECNVEFTAFGGLPTDGGY